MALALIVQLVWIFSDRVAPGRIFQLYFLGLKSCEHLCGAVDRQPQDQSLIQAGLDDPDPGGSHFGTVLYLLFGQSRIAAVMQEKFELALREAATTWCRKKTRRSI